MNSPFPSVSQAKVCRIRAVAGFLFVLIAMAAVGRAQVRPVSVVITKFANFRQTSSAQVTAVRYYRTASALPQTSATLPASAVARLVGPGGTSIPLKTDFFGWSAEQTFASEAEMDAATPGGTYTLEVTGTALSFAGSSNYAAAPLPLTRITNFDLLQAWPGLNPLIEWLPISGALTQDSVRLEIVPEGATSGLSVFPEPANGTVTSLRPRSGESLALRMGRPLTGTLSYTSSRNNLGITLSFPLMTTGPVVYTYAGQTKTRGETDGPRETATLSVFGFTSDAQGNLYCNNFDRVRKVTPAGIVTTVAGQIPSSSLAAPANFYQLAGIAIDAAGTLYVVDSGHQSIKKISPTGVVTLLAGNPVALPGSRDGIGSDARFWYPTGIAVSPDGMVYVADSENATIRKITPGGVVTTFAGLANATGSADGVGAAARFNRPVGLALDPAGNLYVGDGALRRITPDGTVTTLPLLDEVGRPASVGVSTFAFDREGSIYFGGNYQIWRRSPTGVVSYVAGSFASTSYYYPNAPDGMGNNAQVEPSWFAADPGGNIFFSDRGAIRTLAMNPTAATPAIKTVTPLRAPLAVGSALLLRVEPASTGVTGYQWRKERQIISGATGVTLLIPNLAVNDGDTYSVLLFTPSGAAQSDDIPVNVGTFSPAQQGRLVNLSVRTFVGSGEQPLIVGFAVAGNADRNAKPMLIRGLGPALARFGITDFLSDPSLVVFRDASVLARNDNWSGDLAVSTAAARLGAFPLLDINSRDAALQLSVPVPSACSVQLASQGSGGTALVEIYDGTDSAALTATSSRLVNLSARSNLGGPATDLTAGFVVGGNSAEAVLIRAVGPSLSSFGITSFLADPRLELYRGSTLIATNDDWGGDAQIAAIAANVGAFRLASAASKDAVLALTLEPGAYTAVVRSSGNASGVALVEVYEVR